MARVIQEPETGDLWILPKAATPPKCQTTSYDMGDGPFVDLYEILLYGTHLASLLYLPSSWHPVFILYPLLLFIFFLG